MTSSSLGIAPRMKLLCALVASCFAAEGFANPTGPAVAAGAASFNTVGKTLTVTNTPNAIINWKGFSIGAGEITRFQQQGASSAVLNRVVGQDPSAILGTLSSNGKVFLVNPNGVLFGQGSRIDVAGFVASTLNITDPDFLAGRLNFQAGAVSGSIVNQGEIVSASGGRIYLIAPDVQNHGLISSPSGEVVLAAGKTVSLVDADVPNLKVEVQAGGEALNVGKILAEGGKAGIYAGLINQRGIVRADSISQDATGKIVFKASDTTILDDGSLTSAAGAKGGEIQVLGNKVGLVGTARIDASGDAGGGTVLVGGDYQGQNADVQNAYRTYVGLQSSITADAITTGDGGKVIVWSDDATRAYGSISARGGSESGNGGFVEVSGKNWMDFGATVNTSALKGATGVLLLDPAAVIITNTVDVGGSFDGGNPNIFGSGLVTSTVTWTTIKNHLTGASGGSNTNVYITTSGSGCSLPGTCGIDILADSGDLQSSNNLRLISHEYINVNGSVTNTGSGALEMYAGWDGISPTSSPTLSSFDGFITILNPISFNGNVLLRAHAGISQTASGMITTPNLLASTNFGSVILDQVILGNAVDTLAGTFADQFFFKNGQTLTIGNVGGTDGITTSASPSGAPSLVVNVTTGNLIVNSPIFVSDGGGVTAPTSVQLNVQNGGISVNNTSIFAIAGPDDSSDGQTGSVVMNATGGGILISNSTVAAHGGNPGSGPGGSATLSLNATGGITANSASTIIALGKAGVGGSPQPGGDATLTLSAGGEINTSSSALNALGGAPASGGAAGVGSVLVSVNSTLGNTDPNGDIILHNVTADNVNLQQNSKGVARSILRAAPNSLIGASQLLMEVDDTLGLVGGGSIGTSAAPMRVQVSALEAHTHYPSLGIFIDSPNAANLQIGGVSFNSGSVKGVQALAGGDISIGVNGTLSLLAGSANSPCGTGTGGPICTTSGNVTLRADDMAIGNTISGAGVVTLEPYTQSRNVAIFDPLQIAPVALALTPAEVALANAGTSTLQIGRTDGTGTLSVTTPLATTDINAGTLRLIGGNVSLSGNVGSLGTPFDRHLELRANDSVILFIGSVYVADGRSLVLQANNDGLGGGDLFIGGLSAQIDVRAGTTAANTANMFLGGQNITIAGSTGGFGTNVQLSGLGNQIITASGGVLIQGSSSPNGGVFVQALNGSQAITAGGGLRVESGAGNNSSAYVSAGTGQTVNAQYVEVVGQNSGNFTFLQNGTSGLQVITTTGQNASNEGLLVNSAQVENMGGGQTILVNNADHVRVIAQLALAGLSASGTQTITLAGASSLNSLEVSSAGAAFPAQISGANQNITAGSSGQAGAISITGGSGDSQLTGVRNTAGNQTIATSGMIAIVGGTSAGPDGAPTSINNDFGLQTLSANAINLQGGASGTNNNVAIEGSSGQTITVGPGGILLSGGAGTGNNASIDQGSNASTQSITVNGGTIVVQGSASGTSNAAEILSAGNQTISATGITLQGGANGTSNSAMIAALGSQTITANSLTLTAGNAGISNFATIQAPTQDITVHGDLTLMGGGSAPGTTGAGARIGGLGGASPTPTDLLLTVDGNVSLTGGSVAGATGSAIGSAQSAAAQPTTITMDVGGDITLNGGSASGSRIGSSNLNASNGDISITAGGNVTLNGSTTIRTLGAITIDATGALVLTGSNSGSGQTANIFSAGNQTIAAGSITLNGGDAGGADLNGNFAQITSNGTQTITTASDLALNAGLAGINNYAAIIAPTQNITVHGDLSLTGGGSAGSIDGTLGGGARIGGPGAASPAPTNLTLSVDGDVLMTGGSAATSGSAIGSGRAGGQPATITMNVGGNVTLNPGTVANSESRIGSPASNVAAGDISIIAGGTVALNSNPGLGTFIRTLGNVTINAASITQGADSAIIAGGATSLVGGTISLGSSSNDFSGVVDIFGTNVTIKDANTLTLGGVEASNLTVAASTVNQDSSGIVVTGTTNISAGAAALTSATNDFGTVNVTSGGNVAITDANAIAIGTSSVAGTFDIVATSTSFLNGFSANNYSFSGGTYTLAAGTYNLGGTTTVASGATVTASGATINGAAGTMDVAGTFNASSGTVTTSTVNVTGSFNASGATLNAGTANVSGTFNTAGGALNIGTLNVAAGGTLSGTGTIQGNVNNVAGTVSPGASPGILTITGNYTQGASGVLNMEIGGLAAGSDYDQLQVGGTTSLAGTLNTALINGFVPVPGNSFTLIQSTGPVSGTFTTVNSPVGSLFNSFYGPTTFEFVAAASAVLPPPLVVAVNNTIVSTEQLIQPVIEVLEIIPVSAIVSDTTTTAEGQLVPKKTSCQ